MYVCIYINKFISIYTPLLKLTENFKDNEAVNNVYTSLLQLLHAPVSKICMPVFIHVPVLKLMRENNWTHIEYNAFLIGKYEKLHKERLKRIKDARK